MDIKQECMEYFSQKGFKRAFEAMYNKYKSLGRIGGNIIIEEPTKDEREALGKFLRQDLHDKKAITIDIKDFEKKLKETKFEDISLTSIIEGVLKRRLITSKEINEEEQNSRDKLFNEISAMFPYEAVENFIKYIHDNPSDNKMIYARMSDKDKLKKDLINVSRALISLPKGYKETLPVFAARVTSDPHYFDLDAEPGKLLLKALSFKDSCGYPESAEERAELLYNNGIMIDELSNYVLINGLSAWNSDEENLIFKAAVSFRQPLCITLYNLNGITSIKSPVGFAVIVENPSVMSAFMHKAPDIPCICISGQPNLAGLIVLKQLYKSGCKLYYSGDFDPEGILIADKLWRRFPNMEFICMEESYYKKALSDVFLDEKRLKKLAKTENPGLRKLSSCMNRIKFAGYQERIIEDIIRDASEYMKNFQKLIKDLRKV